MKKTLETIGLITVVAILMGTSITAYCATAREVRRDGRFIAYDNGTVLDTSSNLMWAAKDNGSDINWMDAKSYCQNYRTGGFTNWRMPTQSELVGLYEDEIKGYDTSVKGNDRYKMTTLITLTDCCPWASEVTGSNLTGTRLNFTTGKWRITPTSNSKGRVLPVRSIK
jgi:hypothetical protein